jgi:hypothetical protein
MFAAFGTASRIAGGSNSQEETEGGRTTAQSAVELANAALPSR